MAPTSRVAVRTQAWEAGPRAWPASGAHTHSCPGLAFQARAGGWQGPRGLEEPRQEGGKWWRGQENVGPTSILGEASMPPQVSS